MAPSPPDAERGADIALLDQRRQVLVLDQHGTLRPQTAGADPALMWGWWGPDQGGQPAHSWPTWSPSGTRLACFSVPRAGEGAVIVLEVDGIHSVEVADLQGRLPIYLFWSPDGAQIAILSQQTRGASDRLNLTVAPSDRVGSAVQVAEGSPLFFTWIDERIATFVGDPVHGGAQLAVSTPIGHRPTSVLRGQPGNFCAPVWAADRLMYVIQSGPLGSVALAPPDGSEEPEIVETLTGLVALVRSPDGERVARAVAPGGDGTPYRDLAIIDPRTATVTPVADHPCLAYFWQADGTGLLTAHVDTDRNLVTWSRVGLDGSVRHLVDMYPTRDFGFYLRFFEQYVQSHPLVSPDGSTLLLAGGIDGFGDPHRTSGLWEVSLDTGDATRIADGVFGVYGPKH